MNHGHTKHNPEFEAADIGTVKPFGASAWTCAKINRAIDAWWERRHPGQNQKYKHSAFRPKTKKGKTK